MVFSLDTDEELNARLKTIAFIQWKQKWKIKQLRKQLVDKKHFAIREKLYY